MTSDTTIQQAREAFGRQAWLDAYTLLSAANRSAALAPADLDRLAVAAYLLGKDAESIDLWTLAHQEFVSTGDPERAARCGFWLAFGLLNHGERARSGAWVARTRRLLEEGQHDCVECGYLLVPAALEHLIQGDIEGAYRTFCEAERIGGRFHDDDLIALARNGRGRVLIREGKIREGVALLDEAMVAIEAHDVSPIVAGEVYCSVIAGCLEIFDLRRAREWTAEMTHWCESQPDLIAFNGQCLVRRAEILRLHGAWSDACEAAQRACDRCREGPDQPALGAAWYQQGELHRLRGEFVKADEAYRQAGRWGCHPQPGWAQLRLAQGQLEAAATASRCAVDQATAQRTRSRLLPAHVEIMLAADDVEAARAAAGELAAIAEDLDAPFLRASASQARGSVLLAGGDAAAALTALRQAWSAWQEIEAPYEAARVRVLIGLASRALGDRDAAEMELDAARWIFQQLGAGPDAARAESLSRLSPSKTPSGLSPREVQVLRLIATGKTNRAVATELFISERTVERHVSNIFIKLNVSSRAAATAYAYEHQLV